MTEETIEYWKARAKSFESQLYNLGAKPIESRGLHNWKNLFRWPTMMEWVILFMIAMALLGAWAYKHDIQTCWDYVHNQTAFFNLAKLNISNQIDAQYAKFNVSGLNITVIK